jgi:predicted nucleic acid-binding protein
VIVIDASAVTEFLLQTGLGSRVEARIFRDGDDFHAPSLLDVEVVQALRRLVRAGDVQSNRAEAAIEDLTDFDISRHSHLDFLARVWELRHNLTAYDGMYVALAEALDAPLVTCDAPLGVTPGHEARIEVIR